MGCCAALGLEPATDGEPARSVCEAMVVAECGTVAEEMLVIDAVDLSALIEVFVYRGLE